MTSPSSHVRSLVSNTLPTSARSQPCPPSTRLRPLTSRYHYACRCPPVTLRSVILPRRSSHDGCLPKWVFKIKQDQNNRMTRFKARLTVCGYAQRFGRDYYDETFFAPVATTALMHPRALRSRCRPPTLRQSSRCADCLSL